MRMTLSAKFALRGWKSLPYALVDITTGESYFITSKIFNAIIDATSQDTAYLQESEVVSCLIRENILIEEDRELFDYQKYKQYSSRYIKNAHWAVTNFCNYKCKHCFISAPTTTRKGLDTDSCKMIIDKLEEFGIYNLSITGGEPFIRKDIIEIMQYAKSKGILLTGIFTNGSLLTPTHINAMLAIGLRPTFYISFDGWETHDWLRGVKGAREKAMEAIALLKKNHLPVHLTYMILKKNLKLILQDLDSLAMLGVDKIRFGLMSSTGEWSKSGEAHNVSFKEVLEHIVKILPEIIERKYPFSIDIAGIIMIEQYASKFRIPMDKGRIDNELLNKIPCCTCARNSLYINPTGCLTGCEILGELEGEHYPNIITADADSLFCMSHGYSKLANRSLGDLFQVNRDCQTCQYVTVCRGGCRANAYFHSGNINGVDNNACTFFKGGYYEQILQLMEALKVCRCE